ncbi:hypothetical protein HDU91_006709 [Kappamyces sp. JEL0680]|nr:hypothetical protein HDU91_006709 [Kappamyces sp. JEL0680]
MLGNPNDLQNYIDMSSQPDIKKWWAQNAESHGDIDTALKYYTEINDIFSIVRVHCRSGDMNKAIELANLHPENLAVAYYIGKEFEKDEKWQNAMSFFSRAKCYGNAIRIAKLHGIDKELLQLALKSNAVHMIEVAKYGALSNARYFEKIGAVEKAISLYSKGGNKQKAFRLCIQTNNVLLLETIASQLDPAADKELLQTASTVLAEKGSHEAALKLLVLAHKFDEIPLSEDLYNSISLPADLPNEELKRLHNRIGSLFLNQGLYTFACKSFNIGGNRLKAMEALLRSGDKDKIISFASRSVPANAIDVSKHPDIYSMAANYLQSLNWINDTVVMRTIIQYYSKFYESCAQIEIDEYQNYEKALDALVEAEKALEKDLGKTAPGAIQHKRNCISLFLQAQKYEQTDLEQCEAVCAELLNQDGIDGVVRIGDILGLLIQSCVKHGQLEKAKALYERLKMRIVNLSPDYYLDAKICELLDPSFHESHADFIEEDI